jgi:hypothetical protein
MTTATLLIEPTGEIIGLYSELIPLTALGHVTTKRATSVEFNEAIQEWQVTEVGCEAVYYSHPSRQRCLEWEHATFSRPRNLRELKTLNRKSP